MEEPFTGVISKQEGGAASWEGRWLGPGECRKEDSALGGKLEEAGVGVGESMTVQVNTADHHLGKMPRWEVEWCPLCKAWLTASLPSPETLRS